MTERGLWGENEKANNSEASASEEKRGGRYQNEYKNYVEESIFHILLLFLFLITGPMIIAILGFKSIHKKQINPSPYAKWLICPVNYMLQVHSPEI